MSSLIPKVLVHPPLPYVLGGLTSWNIEYSEITVSGSPLDSSSKQEKLVLGGQSVPVIRPRC